MNLELLKELCDAHATSGREQPVIDIMNRELKALKASDITVDEIGNITGVIKSKKKNAKKVMIAGHMDEIGAVISYIDNKGFVYFEPRGGLHARRFLTQRVMIKGDKKSMVGVVESTSHDMNKGVKLDSLFIDTGLSEKAVKKHFQVGDPIVMIGEFLEQGDILISKAFDNRIGCFIVLEVMKKLAKKDLGVDVYILGSSQEEVGVRGAKTAAKRIQPDIGIALDVTAANDLPGYAPQKQVTKLGEGAAIKIQDCGTISNQAIVDSMRSLAKKNKIKYQEELLPFGGTDAMGMQLFGSGLVGAISLPTRYVHSSTEMIHKKDLKACIDLLAKFLENCSKLKASF